MSDIAAAGPRLKAMNDALEIARMRIDPDACTDPVLLAAEVRRLQAVIAALADQDATLSVQGGNVTVTMDATLTDAELEAVEGAIEGEYRPGSWQWAATLRGLLERLK